MYSQNKEDEIVSSIFGDYTGRLLEIGAFDPDALSNSRMLIDRGWEAVLVEFSPQPTRNLIKFYSSNEKVKVMQAAVTPYESGITQFRISDDGLSSDQPRNIARWNGHAGYFGSLLVPQLPVSVLFRYFGGGFDFISVDTEGTSVDVAIAILRECGERPRVMCVEHDERSNELISVASQYGYMLCHVNAENVIVVR